MHRTIIAAFLAGIIFIAFAPPGEAARGSANFTRHVAIGDSLIAGSSNTNPISLAVNHQIWSFPAVISRQAGTPVFEQPLISEPGILPELELRSLSPLVIAPKPGFGAPLNLFLNRPYDNLGIPAARVGDLLTKTGAEQDPNPFYQIILRGRGPAVGQALALQPTFITVWAGNNDVLIGVTGGIPAAMTPIAQFEASYNTLINTLVAGAPNAGMVVATVPPVAQIPFLATIPPVIINPATGQPLLGPDNQPVFFIARVGDQVVQLTPGSAVTLRAQPFLAQGYGIPAALAPFLPPLPHIGEPLPDEVTLTASELATVAARHSAVNQVIKSAAAAHDIPVLDVDELFSRAAEGLHFGGIELDLSYLTGGIISYDGVHPTDIGYTLLANEFIRVINEAYDARIPYASLLPFFANNAALQASALPRWMELNLLESPWSSFVGAGSIDEPEANEPVTDSPSRLRRGARRGPR